MYTVRVYHGSNKLAQYHTTILPMAGDVYASSLFEDGFQRTVKYRQLHTSNDMQTSIIVEVDYSYPNLVPNETKAQ